MKLAVILSLLFEAALASPGTLGIDIYRARKAPGGRDTRGNARAYERFMAAAGDEAELVPESLTNGFYAYFANMTIGSDAQAVNPMIDTGSSDLWVTSAENPYCTQDPNGYKGSDEQWDCTGFLFDPTKSTTYRNLTDPFHISYVDTTGAYGWLSQDTVVLGGATLPNTTFAYATTANSSDSVFGVGYVANEATTRFYHNGTMTGGYKNIPVLLKEDGYINTVAYSLYLNDAHAQYGQVLFGGVDHAKYHGPLGLMPLVNTYYPRINQTIEFMVRLSGMGVRTGANVCPFADFVVPALLDSGTSYAVLPPDLVDAMGKQMNYTWPSLPNATWWQGSCSPSSFDFDSFELDFLGLKLQVPPASLLDVLQDEDGANATDAQGNEICILAIEKAGPYDDYVLGDVFQRNWYVVYDLDNYQVALAQSNLNDTSASNVEPIVSTVPGATSVKNYNLAGFQYTISTHNVAGSCLAQPTSKPVSASASASASASKSAGLSSSVRPSASSAVAPSSAVAASSSVRSVAAAVTSAAQSSGPAPSSASAVVSTAAAAAASSQAASNLAAGRVLSSDPGSPKYVTTVVSSFVTTCPTPTTFATNGQTYTVTDSTVLTITDCPCTLTHAASASVAPSAVAATPSAASASASSAPAEASTTVVSTFVTTCSAPTTFATNGKTYTVTESTVLTITDCPCTLIHSASASASSESASSAGTPAGAASSTSAAGAATSTGAAAPSSTTAGAGSSSSSTSEAAPASSAPAGTSSAEESAAASTSAASSPASEASAAATTPAAASPAPEASAAASSASAPASAPASSAAASSASLPPSLGPETSAPGLANSARRVGAALSAVAGALAVFIIV